MTDKIRRHTFEKGQHYQDIIATNKAEHFYAWSRQHLEEERRRYMSTITILGATLRPCVLHLHKHGENCNNHYHELIETKNA